MAIDFRRIVLKISETASEQPTVPATNDHSDGSWIPTDIYKGELFVNIVDNKVYTRGNSGIFELVGGGSGTAGLLDDVVNLTADYTLQVGDNNKMFRTTGGLDTVITLPSDSTAALEIGSQILFTRASSFEVDFLADTGVTINSVNDFLSISEQGLGASVVKVGANEWDLFGDLKA